MKSKLSVCSSKFNFLYFKLYSFKNCVCSSTSPSSFLANMALNCHLKSGIFIALTRKRAPLYASPDWNMQTHLHKSYRERRGGGGFLNCLNKISNSLRIISKTAPPLENRKQSVTVKMVGMIPSYCTPLSFSIREPGWCAWGGGRIFLRGINWNRSD